MPAIALAPAVPYVVAGAKAVGGAIAGLFTRKVVVEVGKAAAVTGGAYVASQMSTDDEANEEATPVTGTDAGTCVGECPPPGNDPCSGLRRQLNEHKKKLEDYRKDPSAHDNKGFLGQGRDAHIIASRIRSLEHQIKNFAEQLKKCEEENG